MKFKLKEGSTISGFVTRNLTVETFEYKTSGVMEFSSCDLEDVMVNDFDDNQVIYIFKVELPFGTKTTKINQDDLEVTV